jgi:hypothetical protein
MAMNESACPTLQYGGNGVINIEGPNGSAASTYTRSSCPSNALQQNGNGANAATLNALANDVVGGASCTRCNPPATTGADVLDDPFANTPVPPQPGGACATRSITSNTTLSPGCYNSISVSGNNTIVRLQPGVYFIKGGGVSISGNGDKFTADLNNNGQLDSNEQVLFYITCTTSPCNGSVPGPFSVTGQASIGLKGIASPYNNLTIFVDRTAGASATNIVNLAGQGSNQMSGAIYAIASSVSISGNGGQETLQVAVIADKVTIQGNGTLTMQYDLTLIPPIVKQLALVD